MKTQYMVPPLFTVEYVNGQRMLYQSADGYLLAQNNGSWIVEEPSPFCQPAKVSSSTCTCT